MPDGAGRFGFWVILLIVWAVIILLAARFLTGCATAPEDDLPALAHAATAEGVRAHLEKHPDHRAVFNHTAFILRNWRTTGNTNGTNPVAYADYLRSLPVATLHGTKADLLISSRPLVWTGKKAVVVESSPALFAIASGLREGAMPLPPMPPTNRPTRRRLGPVDFTPYTNPIAGGVFLVPLAPAPLVVREVVPSSVALYIEFQWKQTDGPVVIENRDPNSPLSTNWYPLVTLTNATTFRMQWHPSNPIGEWRVIRK